MTSTNDALRTGEVLPPLISPPLPLTTRLNCAIRLWAFKCFVVVGLGVLRLLNRAKFRSHQPTYKKRYSVRPTLENRIFIPSTWKGGEQLPLYINIHGGGFALCDAGIDDEFCRHFADSFDICVVSIDYRLAPVHPFPVPVHDAAEIARAVIEDQDLPVDKSNIAVGGFSAGGNLALAIAQLDGLRGKIKGVVGIYPVVDFAEKTEDKLATVPKGKPDILEHSASLFNWGYLKQGQNRRDPLLSPAFAPRELLPRKICLIGAEYDMLCDEAHKMAEHLAKGEEEEKVGTETSWTCGGILWVKVFGWQHGFTHTRGKDEQEEKERKQVSLDTYRKAAEWLKKEVYI